jgi:hypothetical protein
MTEPNPEAAENDSLAEWIDCRGVLGFEDRSVEVAANVLVSKQGEIGVSFAELLFDVATAWIPRVATDSDGLLMRNYSLHLSAPNGDRLSTEHFHVTHSAISATQEKSRFAAWLPCFGLCTEGHRPKSLSGGAS